MITLVGAGHVFDIGREIENIITSRQPTVVCIELDPQRYQALQSKGSGKRGDAPMAYKALAYFQQKIASKYGTEVGGEMKAAIKAARMVRADLALIDMNAQLVFQRIWKVMGFREKVKLLFGGIAGLFMPKKSIEKELKSYEENSQDYMDLFGDEFPSVKKVLIDERNRFMVKNILKLSQKHEKIVVVVGDGHVSGMLPLLKGQELEVIRLAELREAEKKGDSYSVSYTVESD